MVIKVMVLSVLEEEEEEKKKKKKRMDSEIQVPRNISHLPHGWWDPHP
jgi:hypothetical protein